MKIVFFGTPEYVLPILISLQRKFVNGPGKSPISAVVTQSPKPVGRKQIKTYSAVDRWAFQHKIPIFYSASELLNDPPDATLGILASYGEIITKKVINLFPQGILVIHPSLLPKYRGASPVTEAIKNGDEITGATIFKMDEKVDHGPIISQFKEEILPNDTSGSLRDRLFDRAAKVLVELVEPYNKGKIIPRVQDDNLATYTKTLTRESGYVDLNKDDPKEIDRFIRAMLPWPGAWTWIVLNKKESKKRLKIQQAHLEKDKLILDIVQLEGKSPVSWKQFKEGYNQAEFA